MNEKAMVLRIGLVSDNSYDETSGSGLWGAYDSNSYS
jgi:hypothetical protein